MKVIASLAVLLSAAAVSAQPANDNFASATVVTSIPFADALDTTLATTEATDVDCRGNGPTVWYAFTAGDEGRIEANTFGSNYDTTIAVVTGAPGEFYLLACNDDHQGLQSLVHLDVQPGETYYVAVGAFASGSGGSLVFNLGLAPPPPPALTINVAVSGANVAPAKGTGSVSGTITCSNDANVFVQGDVQQKSQSGAAFGHFATFAFCTAGTTTAFTAPMFSEPVRGAGRSSSLLRGGPASYNLFADGFDLFGQGASTSASGSLNLRAGH